MSYRIINPVLSGFYPCPSVCLANGIWYMVTSSFTYFPGLPVFSSKNGVTWNQIGNVISRENQINMKGKHNDGRILAPTIRFFDDTFYCICGQASELGIFLCTTHNPSEPDAWSVPKKIEGATGEDPSLYFDEDGTVWYCGYRPATTGKFYEGQNEIYLQRIDLNAGKLTGEPKVIMTSTSKFTYDYNGPHIFKYNEKYYLVYSEGGTGLNHAVSIARSDRIDGEYELKPSNPILTHRSMGQTAGLISVGHSDFICDKDGKWWMIVSAIRPYGEKNKRGYNMGRETFMVPVVWEDDWPVVARQTGHIDNAYSLSGLVVNRDYDDADAIIWPTIDDFNENRFKPFWCFHRFRNENLIKIGERSGHVRLYGGAPIVTEENISMVIRRQTGFCYEASTVVECNFAQDGDCAGIICYQNEKFNLRLQIKLAGKVIILQFIKCTDGKDEVVKEEVVNGGTKTAVMVFRIVAEKQQLKFEYGPDERNMNILAEKVDSSFLAPDKAGGYSGIMIGMFAVSGGDFKQKNFFADFDWFKYENITRDWQS